jgi:hypothetical protein
MKVCVKLGVCGRVLHRTSHESILLFWTHFQNHCISQLSSLMNVDNYHRIGCSLPLWECLNGINTILYEWLYEKRHEMWLEGVKHGMRRDNKILIVLVLILFLYCVYAYRGVLDRRGNRYIPYRFKSSEYESPTYTPHGLVFVDGFLWISSAYNHALIKYDLSTGTVVESFQIPCFEAAGLAFDGENFWVADYAKRTLYDISPQGEVLNTYRTPYSTPYGVTWDGENLWILDVFGLKEYPDIYANLYPNSILYKYDPERDAILDLIDSPAPFAGDIAYKDGEIAVTGCTSRKIYHVVIETKDQTSWYYSPDRFPRAIAAGEENSYLVSGMATRNIWNVNLDLKAQYKDYFRISDITIPLWLIIITSILLLPIVLDEIMRKEYTKKKSVYERVREQNSLINKLRRKLDEIVK